MAWALSCLSRPRTPSADSANATDGTALQMALRAAQSNVSQVRRPWCSAIASACSSTRQMQPIDPRPNVLRARSTARAIAARPGGTRHMSDVWSCNEWDPLEEVIVGNPLNARFPTPDRSTQVAEFSDRSLAEIPRGPFPQRIIEETEEDLNEFIRHPGEAGRHGQAAGDVAARRQVLDGSLGSPGLLQLLSPRRLAGRRRPDHRNAQCHPQPFARRHSAIARC